MGLLDSSRTYFYFIQVKSNDGFNPIEVSQFGNGDSIYVDGHYRTDS
jgi:hypothetical protein